jgi:hypothetical protein
MQKLLVLISPNVELFELSTGGLLFLLVFGGGA